MAQVPLWGHACCFLMQTLLGCPIRALFSRLSSFAALVYPQLNLYWSKKKHFVFRRGGWVHHKLFHCAIAAVVLNAGVHDVLQGRAFPCGPWVCAQEGCECRAELKARLESEVAHLIGLPKKGSMKVGYFRMMETAGWFCKKREGVATRLWSQVANISPCFCLSGFSVLPTRCSEDSVTVPASSVAVLSKVEKRFPMHCDRKLFICCPSQDLRMPHYFRGFLFDFGQALFICSMFGVS